MRMKRLRGNSPRISGARFEREPSRPQRRSHRPGVRIPVSRARRGPRRERAERRVRRVRRVPRVSELDVLHRLRAPLPVPLLHPLPTLHGLFALPGLEGPRRVQPLHRDGELRPLPVRGALGRAFGLRLLFRLRWPVGERLPHPQRAVRPRDVLRRDEETPHGARSRAIDTMTRAGRTAPGVGT